MARFGLTSLVPKSRKSRTPLTPTNVSTSLSVVSEEPGSTVHTVGPVIPGAFSNSSNSSASISPDVASIANSSSPNEHSNAFTSSSSNDSISLDSSDQNEGWSALFGRKQSFDSSVDTLFMNDSASTAHTLLAGADVQTQSTTTRQQQYSGNSRALPIYATRFRSGVQVFESDVAAKVFRTLHRQRKVQQQPSSSEASSSACSPPHIPIPPALQCQSVSSYNPFSSKKTPFMTINRLGKTIRSTSTGQRPKTLLANTVLQHHIELGLTQADTAVISEETVTSLPPFCQVWQTVLSNDHVKYTLEFDNALDYAQSTVVLINDGRNRVTRTSYDGVQMQWNGTTGLASPFGSGYFELRFCDQDQLAQHQQRRPPVAVYHNVGVKTLASTRKVGEFVIWEPGFEFADIIVVMGMVLREQEERKEIEGHRIASNKLANF